MKKIVLTAASLLLITSICITYVVKANTSAELKAIQEIPLTSTSSPIIEEDMEKFMEYDVLEEVINIGNYVAKVVENHKQKRVIVLEDAKGKPKFKSIYNKHTEHLKVIDLKEGILFDDNLEKESEEVARSEGIEEAAGIETFAEYEKLAVYTDVENYTVHVIEDNEQKRIIHLENGSGQPQYKSIYLHHKKVLKIIDLRGGLLFEGEI